MINEKDLGKAIKEEKSTIEIEGDLARKVIKIKATGSVAWGVCIGALGVAIAAIIAVPTTAGTSAPVSSLVATPALAGVVTVLGTGVTVSAITIAVAAGGVGALNKLRDYDMDKISDTKIILRKKEK